MLSLPGSRWRQLNEGEDDTRLWQDRKYHLQAFRFWKQLAARLKAHPAIVAYNPLNEPHPDKAFGFDAPDESFARWFRRIQNTPADLNEFNRGMVDAIRSVDVDTPIMLDGWFYASPQAFKYNRPVEDKRVLYAFHNPGPWEMVTYRINQGRYATRIACPSRRTGQRSPGRQIASRRKFLRSSSSPRLTTFQAIASSPLSSGATVALRERRPTWETSFRSTTSASGTGRSMLSR